MKLTSFPALLTSLAIAACAAPPAPQPPLPPAPPSGEPRPLPPRIEISRYGKLITTFSRCVSATGVSASLPVATSFPSGEELGDWIPLWPADGANHLADGYRHWLRLHKSTNMVYIVQVGGFAGTRTIYGPIPADKDCDFAPQVAPK